jgi:pimeloyl-ACP methyl ester carboxylesterase
MKKGGRNYMKHIIRDKTAYAYKEVGSGPPPLVFVHGWACDHSFFSPQIDYFSRYHRVIAPDLPGHGASDACPLQKYTVTQFADDLAWLCRELQVEQAVLVGHSMGGVVALEAAGKYLQLAAAVCLIDSVVFPPDAFLAELRRLGEQLATTNYTEVLQRAAASLFIEKDDPERKIRLLAKMAKTPQHVAVPAFRSHLLDYDFARAAQACRVPTAYIAATNLMADLDQFRRFCPQPETAQAMGSGHFSQLEVPEQINAMLQRFVTASLLRELCIPGAFRPN